jgi:hypothetical protein
MLPFIVRKVTSEADLARAVEVRYAAYQRHAASFAEALRTPEPLDRRPGTVVLLAEDKSDRAALGTMRIQTNAYEPLVLEQSITLPDWLQSRRLAEATRLGVTHDAIGPLVKNALFKAGILYCRVASVQNIVIAGRAPIDRQYDALQFEEVYPGLGYIPLRHAGGVPHRILMLEVESARQRWQAVRHPLYEFVFETEHVEIDVSEYARSG